MSTMKIGRLILIIVLGALLVGSVFSGCAGLPKPTVGYVPEGWSVLSDHVYTTCLGFDEGVLIYGDGALQKPNSVEIHYHNMHEEDRAVGGQSITDVDRIITEWAIYNLEYDSIEVEESGAMLVGGQIAGYAKGYDPVGGNYVLVLQCFNEPICYSLRALWKPTFDEADVKRLIESISF